MARFLLYLCILIMTASFISCSSKVEEADSKKINTSNKVDLNNKIELQKNIDSNIDNIQKVLQQLNAISTNIKPLINVKSSNDAFELLKSFNDSFSKKINYFNINEKSVVSTINSNIDGCEQLSIKTQYAVDTNNSNYKFSTLNCNSSEGESELFNVVLNNTIRININLINFYNLLNIKNKKLENSDSYCEFGTDNNGFCTNIILFKTNKTIFKANLEINTSTISVDITGLSLNNDEVKAKFKIELNKENLNSKITQSEVNDYDL